MSDIPIPCSVYRSPKKEGMYLYVPRENPFERVPADLLQHFGTPTLVLELDLTDNRKLARAIAKDVIDGVCQQGYYLQMPPLEQSS